MSGRPFVDHYETLHLSPSADRETVERVFRLLAKRYHPDNPATGNVDRFNDVCEAYDVLSDARSRAAYDATYERDRSEEWQALRREVDSGGPGDDQRLFDAVLSILYVARRRDPANAGLAPSHLERMLGLPREHLDFPLWYLKQRGLVEILGNGLTAITVDGVDRLGSEGLSLPARRLLTDVTAPEEPGGDADDDSDYLEEASGGG